MEENHSKFKGIRVKKNYEPGKPVNIHANWKTYKTNR